MTVPGDETALVEPESRIRATGSLSDAKKGAERVLRSQPLEERAARKRQLPPELAGSLAQALLREE